MLLRKIAVGLLWLHLLANAFVFLAQGSLIDTAALAQALYEQGDFSGSITLYESLLAAGVHDGAVYYNLGNAYFEAKNLGKALLNYRRAQALMPRDGDLNANLARVRAGRVDIQGDETMLIDALASLTSSILTLVELSWLALVLWMLLFALLAAWLVRADQHDVLRVPLLVMSILTISVMVMLGSRLFVESNRPAGVALTDTAVMTGPGEDYLEIYRLYSAAELRVIEQRGDWVRFILPDQRQGWIRRNAVEII